MAGRDRRVIEEDLANVEFETSEDVDVVPTFDSMKLREDLLRGVYAYGKKIPVKKKNDLKSNLDHSRIRKTFGNSTKGH